ncbi:hypothetical protein CORC01_12782 [Colletotrichum orchidophilum]|uniref:Tat pathway signal sequence n=1 Tax=Colletotrichum orchidophilum TaxID=1209926 RepID=A0A1G4ASC3_9PEZI|nr:uncharacterized protein CORC01_12782 [Colletotrichum orchidophilum]OHE91932.1 hypothetical protein CORC01_12782 [Colletotrichum orchidophilum]
MDRDSSGLGVKLLAAEVNDSEHGPLCSRCEKAITGETSSSRFSRFKLLLVFFLCQIPILCLSFLAFHTFQTKTGDTSQGIDQQDYFTLENYNTTEKLYNIVDAADRSPEADAFWHEMQKTDGIVAVHSEWAKQNGLPATVAYPDDSDYKVYQINVFHALHCLYRIRNRLTSKIPLEKWPRNDIHTMHCVDHIRNDLMCHADISLSGSDEYVSFNSHSHHQKCRDLGALQKWAKQHGWVGYKEYLEGDVGYDPIEAERVNMATAGKGHWNKAQSKLDKETGKIELWFEED